MNEREADIRAVQERVDRHNELAAKYHFQIEALRHEASAESEIWDILLSQMFMNAALGADPQYRLPDPLLHAALDFGLQCMGVGAIMAMDGLAQERIVI